MEGGLRLPLTRFMNESFTKWLSVNLNDLERLVIDGDSLCACLYKKHHGWARGGDYLGFHSTVREFFSEILFTEVQILVIFSGIEKEHLGGVGTRHIDNTQVNETLRRAQGQIGWRTFDEIRIVPLMVTKVFVDVVRSLGIQVRVADGEGTKEVAAFANYYKCPVVADDPNFFLFELDYGYVPIEKLSTLIANGLLYQFREFQSQFRLKDPKSRLIIPALYGTDFKGDTDLQNTLQLISSHETCDAYLDKKADVDVRKNFEAAVKFYYDLPLPLDRDPQSPVLSGIFEGLPEWVNRRYRLGCFEPQLLNARVNNTCVLCTVIEDIRRESAWLASRSVRQFLYGFMGVPAVAQVRELIRAKSSPEVTEVHVSPSFFDPPRTLEDFADMDKKTRANIVLTVLKCCVISPDDIKQVFNTLSAEWKLPIAATLYWYHACDNPSAQRHLVKSLLLSFLVCSGEMKLKKTPSLEQLTRDTKQDYLSALHAFAQWQCVYRDAMALNCLVREPFPTTSPAFLFSGRLAMYYASFAHKNQNVDDVVMAHGPASDLWMLYNQFLYLVTGCDGKGRRGQHAKHQPKAKDMHVAKVAALPVESNRYALLARLDTKEA